MAGTGTFAGQRRPSTGWSRLRSVQADPLEEMGLPSKGDTRHADSRNVAREAQADNRQASRLQSSGDIL